MQAILKRCAPQRPPCSCSTLEEGAEFQPSPFFNEQLTAFELWLEHGSEHKRPPEQLPIVLQVRPLRLLWQASVSHCRLAPGLSYGPEREPCLKPFG